MKKQTIIICVFLFLIFVLSIKVNASNATDTSVPENKCDIGYTDWGIFKYNDSVICPKCNGTDFKCIYIKGAELGDEFVTNKDYVRTTYINSCYARGSAKAIQCSRSECKKIYWRIYTNEEPKPHSYTGETCLKTCEECGKESVVHSYIDATCTKPKTCTVCGNTEGNALGHSFVNGVCTRTNCGERNGWDLSNNGKTAGNAIAELKEDGTLVIKSSDPNNEKYNIADYDHPTFGNESKKCPITGTERIKKVHFQGNPVNIGSYLFFYCTNLEEVIIDNPQYLDYIGEGAFFGCKNLEQFNIPENITKIGARAFCHCHELKKLDFANAKNLVRLGHEVARDCYSLRTVTLPEGLKVIGYEAFLNCISLKKLVIPGTVVAMGTTGAREDEVGLGDPNQLNEEDKEKYSTTGYNNIFTIRNNGSKEFEDYIKGVLDDNQIPYDDTNFISEIIKLFTKTRIWYYSDHNIAKEYKTQRAESEMMMSELSWDLSNNGKVSGEAVAKLMGDGTLVISSNISEDEPYWIANYDHPNYGDKVCPIIEGHRIKKVHFKGNPQNIGAYLLYYCNNLEEVIIDNPQNIEYIGSGAFFGCQNLKEFTIPENVTAIGGRAFCHCHELKELDFAKAKNLVRLGHEVARDCYSLRTVTLPEGLKVIGYEAFLNCISLNDLIIPSTVLAMGTTGAREDEVGLGTPNQLSEEDKQTYNTTGYNNIFTIDFSGNSNQSEYKKYMKNILDENKITYDDSNMVSKITELLLANTTVWYYTDNNISAEYKADSIARQKENNIKEIKMDVITNYSHDHEWENGKCTVCKEECSHQGEWNLETLTCKICEYKCTHDTGDYVIEAVEDGHKIKCAYCEWIKYYIHDTINGEIVAPTCTEKGYTKHKCEFCDYEKKTNYIDELGHDWDEGEITKLATCKDKGEKTYTCTVCSKTKTEEIAVTENHVWDNGKVTKTPTCTQEGEKTFTCTVCSAANKEPIAKIGHTEVIDKAVAATCTEAGLTEGKHCAICSKVILAQTPIPAKGHTQVVDKAVAATCTEPGLTEGKHCSVCNDVLVPQTETPALGHDFENGKCTECGAEDPKIKVNDTEDYDVDELKYYILKIQPQTKVKDFIKSLNTNATQKEIYDGETKINEENFVGTGMQLRLNGEEAVYTLIVSGDTNGDGEAKLSDMTKINKCRLHRDTLEGVYFLAGDVNGDGELDIKDLVKINRYRLHKINTL